MHGSEQFLLQFMEGSSNRFFIPVYQRNYEWKLEQCKQLYDDLVRVSKENRKSHFFGSIVSAPVENGAMGHHLLIDGQQRVTTVSLLLLAIANLINDGKVKATNSKLSQKIVEEYLIDKFAEDEDHKLKLKTAKNDQDNYSRLFSDDKEIPQNTNLAINYSYFCNRILQGELTPDELFQSISKLQIINIYLSADDNPQLIFESLNSTGLDLSEGDKVRNYVLMGLKSSLQEKYYKKYWHEIEKNTEFNVSLFLRDYLSIKNQVTPVFSRIYPVFKEYAQRHPSPDIEPILEDLLIYSKIYGLLLDPKGVSTALQRSITRLNRFEATVTRPFLMEVLRTSQKEPDIVPTRDVERIFILVESYLLRRQVCDIPSNALNKIFVTLHRDIMRLDGKLNDYYNKLNYILLQKTESGLFPDDELFLDSLSTKRIYQMRAKSKQYILERFENRDSKEYKDIWGYLDSKQYTIEHVMPQTLSAEWRTALGPNYAEIHARWLDRLANLTLTTYNPDYSNLPFETKKTMENGYLRSGIAMNLEIAQYDTWDEEALIHRNDSMMKQAKKLWPMAISSYEPPEDELHVFSLADDFDIVGRRITRFSLEGAEQNVDSWLEMFSKVIGTLYMNNPTPLNQAMTSEKTYNLVSDFLVITPASEGEANKISDGLYFKAGTNNQKKFNLLRIILALYNIEETDLVFYLRKPEPNVVTPESGVPKLRYDFWSFALPGIIKQTGRFKNRNPLSCNVYNSETEIKGVWIGINANLNKCRVDLTIRTESREKTNDIFDYLHNDRQHLQQAVKYPITWQNKPEHKSAFMSINLEGFGIEHEANWENCADFLAYGVNAMEEKVVPLIKSFLDNYQEG